MPFDDYMISRSGHGKDFAGHCRGLADVHMSAIGPFYAFLRFFMRSFARLD